MDFEKVKLHCELTNVLSAKIVDGYLIPYCSKRENLDESIARKLALYRDVVHQMPEEWAFCAASQYVTHRLFRKNGYINKYLGQSELKNRSDEEKGWLNYQAEHPWRLSFFSIINNPHQDFFTVRDELIGEELLLQSPGIQTILKQSGPMQMFFLLVSFNGECWQTYGNLVNLRSMQPFDLLYFAKQIDPNLDFLSSILDLIDKDPIPWMLLWRGGEIPLSVHEDELIVYNKSEFHEPDFKPETYSDHFTITKKYPVYKMQLKRWDTHPHFAICYYHAKKNRLVLTAMTDRGYEFLVKAFEEAGYTLPRASEIRATMAMIITAKEILKTDFELVPYEKTFAEPASPEQEKELAKINAFVKNYLEYHNAGKKFDLHALATAAGIDDNLARNVVEQIEKTSSKYRNK